LASKYFPLTTVTLRSGSKTLYKLATVPVKPFIAERIIIKAAVVIAIAVILIQLIILMALLDFLETK
jgi:hypothetical protein